MFKTKFSGHKRLGLTGPECPPWLRAWVGGEGSICLVAHPE